MRILALALAATIGAAAAADAAILRYDYQGGTLYLPDDLPDFGNNLPPSSVFAPTYTLLLDESRLAKPIANSTITLDDFDGCSDPEEYWDVSCLAQKGLTFIANDYVGFPSRAWNVFSFTFDAQKQIISHFIDNSRDPETSLSTPDGDYLDFLWWDDDWQNDYMIQYASDGPGVWTGPITEPASVPLPASAWLLAGALAGLAGMRRRISR
jgi:hypothetical protein